MSESCVQGLSRCLLAMPSGGQVATKEILNEYCKYVVYVISIVPVSYVPQVGRHDYNILVLLYALTIPPIF